MTGVSLATFLAGIGVGLAVAVPIGPMGVLCIQRTLAFGLVAGLATGLGAATVHMAFGSVAALGLGATATAWLGSGAQGLSLVSAGLLFWFAARILRRATVTDFDLPQPRGWLHSYVSAFLIGLSNPLTILLFVAAIPALTASGDLEAVPVLITGVFLGSITWWAVLSTTISLIRGRLSAGAIGLTNKASGLTLAALGTLMLVNAFRPPLQ
jgi:threonine/homoserine/homoserine lactone efflux protein